MVELDLFHYLPRRSPLHRTDARLKLVAATLLSLTAGLSRSSFDIGVVSVFLGGAVWLARLPVGLLLGQLRRFAFIIGATITIQAVGHPGTPLVAGLPGITRAGLAVGLLMAWRLGAVIVTGLLLTGCTQLTETRAAVYWFLRPFSGKGAARVATMFSLVLTLIPLIFDQAATIHEAQLSRGAALVKNPWRRLRWLVWPVLRETFRRADDLILAMESRCYNEERTQPEFGGARMDAGLLGLVLVVLGLVVWLG
jgi:biotin transport system permease protein